MPALSQNFFFNTGADSNQNAIMSSTITYPPATSGDVTYYSEKLKGDGYYGGHGLHTITIIPYYEPTSGPSNINNFVGNVVMQASLATNPADTDWFDISTTATTFDSSYHDNTYYNFQGNFVWIRAKVVISAGVLTAILYNH